MKYEEEMPEWLKKCITCVHSYQRRDDDYYYCRLRKGKCVYKEIEGLNDNV